MRYTAAFKDEIVKKLTTPGGPSATTLSREIGISQPTLSRWVREAGGVARMSEKKPGGGKRPQDWSMEEKLQIVVEAQQLSEAELGGFLRSKGLYHTHLEHWRKQMLCGLAAPQPAKRKPAAAENKRIRQLERELRRKERALAEAAALLILQKKVRAIWGDEDDEPASRSGK